MSEHLLLFRKQKVLPNSIRFVQHKNQQLNKTKQQQNKLNLIQGLFILLYIFLYTFIPLLAFICKTAAQIYKIPKKKITLIFFFRTLQNRIMSQSANLPNTFKITSVKTGENRRFPASKSFADLRESLSSFWGQHDFVLTYL